MRSKQQIEDMLNSIDSSGATRFSGMKFEQGIAEALEWVLGNDEALTDFVRPERSK